MTRYPRAIFEPRKEYEFTLNFTVEIILLLILLKGVVIVGFVILSRIPEIVLRVPWTIHMCNVSERLPLFVLRTCSTRFIASL
jgi:hypothetical protein